MISLTKILRGGGVAVLLLIGYAVLYLGLTPFAIAVVLVVGGSGSLVAIVAKQPMIQLAGLALAGAAVLALIALPSIAFLAAGLVAVFVALFGGK